MKVQSSQCKSIWPFMKRNITGTMSLIISLEPFVPCRRSSQWLQKDCVRIYTPGKFPTGCTTDCTIINSQTMCQPGCVIAVDLYMCFSVLRQNDVQAFFNFLSVTAVAMAVSNSGGNAVIQTLQVMAAHAVILPLTICAGIEVSGAHFNPMVTGCFVLIGKLVRIDLSSLQYKAPPCGIWK